MGGVRVGVGRCICFDLVKVRGEEYDVKHSQCCPTLVPHTSSECRVVVEESCLVECTRGVLACVIRVPLLLLQRSGLG
jgi:hypothetical protein